jgi:hypothetical protein
VYNNTKTKGTQAEIECLRFFVNDGFQVSIPFGENAPYDMLVESPTNLIYRVQVRYATRKNGVVKVSLRAVSKSYSRPLDFSSIDTFAVFDGQDVYGIPVQLAQEYKAVIQLRVEPTKNNQMKGVISAENYLNGLRYVP